MISKVLLATVTASVFLSANALAQEREVFSFGDSLSDTGNVFGIAENVTGYVPTGVVYYRGAFSNGPVWVDLLSRNQARYPGLLEFQSSASTQGANLAHGGAISGTGSDIVTGPASFSAQVDAFAELVESNQVSIDPEDVFTVWTGANDYLGSDSAQPTVTVSNIEEGILDLIDLGAETVLVLNLPDLGKTPSSLKAGAQTAALQSLYTEIHNSLLSVAVNQISLTTDAQVILLDAGALFDDLIENPSKYGFSVVDQDCLSAGLTMGKCPADWLFYDTVHPTYRAHAILADIAADVLEDAE